MELAQVDLDGCVEATGTVVVIDVLRAFTTEAYALAAGASEILLVAGVDEARRLRDADPQLLAMGERDGRPLAGFDLSNSPSEVARADLTGRRIVHRTTAGTQGVVRSTRADALVAASFAVAEATVAWLVEQDPRRVTFVVTGAHSGRDGDEDRALADYLAARLEGHRPDPGPYLERVRTSDAGRLFGRADHPWLPAEDLDRCTEIDRFDFALPVVSAPTSGAERSPPPCVTAPTGRSTHPPLRSC